MPWNVRTPALDRVVFDGQSLNLQPAAPNNYPTFCMSGLDTVWNNVAIGGTSWTTLATTATTRRDAVVNEATKCILVMQGGQTDMMAPESDTGAELYADMGSYATSARAAGFTHIIATTLPPTTAPWGINQTERAAGNVLILADASTYFDDVVDLDVAPLNNASNATYYSDGAHWTTAGAMAAADLVRPAITALLA